MNKNIIQFKKSLSKKNILELVDELELFEYYILHDVVIGKLMLSPLRYETKPSFIIYKATKSSETKYVFKDFGNGAFGDVFEFIGLKLHLNFASVLRRIKLDFNLNSLDDEILFKSIVSTDDINYYEIIGNEKILKKINNNSPNEITFSIRNRDLAGNNFYWNKYDISNQILNYHNIYEVNILYLNGKSISYYNNTNPIFVYILRNNTNPDDRNCYYKLYQPYSLNYKFSGKCHLYTIQGFNQLVKELTDEKILSLKYFKENVLIISKSMKETMLIKKYGFYSISVHSESSFLPKEIILKLKNKFKTIYLLYDNDETGYKNSEKFSKLYDLKPIFTPKEKDFADFYELNKEEAEYFLLSLDY